MADVEITLGIDDNQYQTDLENVKSDTTKTAKKSGDEIERNVGQRGSAAFRRLALAAAAAAGAIAAGLFTRSSIAAASEQETVTRRLEAALFASGQEVENNTIKIKELADELQATTTLSNEAVEAQAAFALSLGATADQVSPLIRASADLSSALGVSLQSATQQLSRTLQGDLSARLAQVIPELRNLTEEQLRAGAAVDFVAQRFAGFAASEAATFAGSLTQLSENFADLQKAFGQFVTESTLVRNSIQLINEGVQSISGFLERIQPQVTAFGEAFARAFLIAGRQVEIFVRETVAVFEPWFNLIQARTVQLLGIFNRFGAQLQGILNVFRVFKDGFVTGLNTIVFAAFSAIDALERLDRFNLTGLEGLRETIDEGLLRSLNSTEESSERTRQSINRLFDPAEYKPQEVTDVFRNFFSEIEEASRDSEGNLIFDRLLSAFERENIEEVSQNLSLLEQGLSSTLNKSEQKVKAFSVSFKKATVDITEALNNTFVNGATQSFQEFGRQLAAGELNFKSFVGIALNALGDLAISIGSTVIAASAAIQAIPFSSGVLLGAALVAVGGAVKAFAGQFGEASTPSPNFGDGGAGFASPPPTVPETDLLEEESGREAQRNVQVVVEGNIFDLDETGDRIVDVLNKKFEVNNASFVGARFS